jgi:hypothetical protein
MRHKPAIPVSVWLTVVLAVALGGCLNNPRISPPPTPPPTSPPTPSPAPSPPPTPRNPLEGNGLYESCDLRATKDTCASNLKQMSAGGFKLVINYNQFSADYTEADVTAYLDAATAVGLKIVLTMKDAFWWDGTDLRAMFPKLAVTCGCTDNKSFVQYIVRTFGAHPASWGYYLGDETETAQHAQWLPFAELVGATDPVHPRLFVHYVQQACCEPVLNPDLLVFADGVDVIAEDYYPIGRTDPPPPSSYVGVMAKQVQDAAKARNKSGAIVLQSYALSQYDAACTPKSVCQQFPTYTQLLAMRDAALSAAQPRFIFWYSFFDIQRSSDPSGHWNDLVRAIGMPNPK